MIYIQRVQNAVISLAVMVLLRRLRSFSVVGVSISGAVAHNLGQILVAALLISHTGIFVYFPVLIFSGIITGALIGIASHLILKRLPKSNTL